MNKKMTWRARAGKCGLFGASGWIGALSAARASKPLRSRIDASASIPNPPPARRRNSRRLTGQRRGADGPGQLFASLHIDKSIQVKKRAAKFFQGLILFPTLLAFTIASFQEFLRKSSLLVRWFASYDKAKGAVDPFFWQPSLHHDSCRGCSRGGHDFFGIQ